jgi:hypothetical protein
LLSGLPEKVDEADNLVSTNVLCLEESLVLS